MNQSAKRALAVVALTEGDAAEWRKVNQSVFVIPDVVHLNETESFSDGESKSVIFVGRLSKQKDIGSLLSAWQMVRLRHPDWQLHIYGEKGDLEESLWQQLLEDGHGVNVHPPTLHIMDAYRQCAILLFTSCYEPFGMVLPEAMSCGLPVVAFDCPYGPADIITHESDGFLVQDRDVNRFADYVCQLIESPCLRQTMGTTGVKAVQRYQADHIMPQWQDLFASLISK
jgi:glycosyltransferase involved in cell wall biosynthesis